MRTVPPYGRVRGPHPHLDAACHAAGRTALRPSGWLPQHLPEACRYVVRASSGRSRGNRCGPFGKLGSNAPRRLG